jgi:hypothetical protein
LANLRQRPSHARVRSTTQRLGKTPKPFAVSERLTISVTRQGLLLSIAKLRSLIAVVSEQPLKKRKSPEQCVQNENASIAILNVGAMNDGVKQQTYRVDENMPFLAFDLFARIITMRIDAVPPFSALFTLWLSMTAAVELASRPAASRHFTNSIW